jgi:RNA polymerase sigma-70 factor (ECF subfamily)
MDLGPASHADITTLPTRPEHAWVTPVADDAVLPVDGDPAVIAAGRESIRLAFVAALQYLPPRQRVVLILREVLSWHATEVASLLDTTVASVNSALQRARATLSEHALDQPEDVDPEHAALLASYVDAFERYDIEKLVTLLHADAVMSMPPFDLWLRGPLDMGQWFLGQGAECRGSRLVATKANGCAAFGSYRIDPNGGYSPWALQVIETAGGLITGHHHFLDTNLFSTFGLPSHLDG